MTCKTEFPDFPDSDMPAIPAGFEDSSWHNDACPSMRNATLQLLIWINYSDPEKQETLGWPRFLVVDENDERGEATLETDDWNEVLQHLAVLA